MSEPTSERTPDSSGQRAIEDIRPEHGALARPSGPPTTLGPQVPVKPFWSETQRDEAILRACRPSHLPREVPEAGVGQMNSVSPPREAPDAVRMRPRELLRRSGQRPTRSMPRLELRRCVSWALKSNGWRRMAPTICTKVAMCERFWTGMLVERALGSSRSQRRRRRVHRHLASAEGHGGAFVVVWQD